MELIMVNELGQKVPYKIINGRAYMVGERGYLIPSHSDVLLVENLIEVK